MPEKESFPLDQSAKVDRTRQLREGLNLKDRISALVESHGGVYDVELGYDDAIDEMATERFDREVLKAIDGGVEGVYRELVGAGERYTAESIVFDYHREKGIIS